MAHNDMRIPDKAIDAHLRATMEANSRIYGVPHALLENLPADELAKARAIARAGIKAFLNAWL
jgi:hypothetical protein